MSLVNKVTGWLLRLRNRHFLAFDVFVLTLTPFIALELRTDGSAAWDAYGFSVVTIVIVFLAIKLAIFFPAKLYNRYWRYASVDELTNITLAVLGAVCLQTLVFFFVLRPFGIISSEFPRSIPLIEGLLALFLVGGGRYIVRVAHRGSQRLGEGEGAKRVLIVGAGEAGLMIVGEMQRHAQLGLRPVGFIDDDPHKQRMRIRGINVLGARHDIPRLTGELQAKMVVIAIPRAPGKEIRDIVRICETTGVETKVIPGVYELLDGVSISTLRDVQVEDLLRRPPVQTNTDTVAKQVEGARILVTGGGGSIGSELCRQIMRLKPAALILLGHGENSLFTVEAELRRYLASRSLQIEVRTVLADIRDRARLEQVFETFQPEIVYHAAAHKHVTLMEQNVAEAVTNNVGGTRNLLELSGKHGVERFVMISTDKAVNPTSVMGTSKRVAELLLADAARRYGKAFMAVRFGNVLGSRGSVLKVFRDQIARGGPITVTDPNVERYFMTIPEAVQLVLQAGAMGQGGELFVLDMGEPVKIMDLARDLIRLSGKREGRDLDIVVTGLRPGEKMSESLFKDDERAEETEHGKILVCRNGHVGAWEEENFASSINELLSAAAEGRVDQTKLIMHRLVPEATLEGVQKTIGFSRTRQPLNT